jgi:hypothetical protein
LRRQKRVAVAAASADLKNLIKKLDFATIQKRGVTG